MKSITDKLISVEEAVFALKCMQQHSFTVAEAMDSVEDVITRVRNIDMARLTNYIIDTRLTAVQQYVIRHCCLDSMSINQCASELGLSPRGVYSARARGMEIIGEYLEPLVMYFRDLPGREEVPVFVGNSLSILSAKNKNQGKINEILKSIRTAHSVSIKDIAKISGIREKDILSAEKGNKALTVDEIENYSRLFGVKILLEFDKGTVTAKWKEQ